MPNRTLEQRVTALEHQVAALKIREMNGRDEKPWLHVQGIFAGDRGMREIFDEALKLRDHDLVAPQASQVRPAQECSGLGKCLEGLALQAQDRCQGTVQLRVSGRRLRPG